MRCDSSPKSVPVSFSFTYQLANLKSTLTLWEDMVSKTMKLNTALRTVIQCIAGFLEAFQKVADSAYSSNCGLRELGSSMTRFCLRERGLESRLRIFNSQLLDCLAAPLADRLEEWRRTVTQLDRENSKEWRRARNELQRVTCEFEKLNKRFHRKGSIRSHSEPVGEMGTELNVDSGKTGDNVQMNFVQHDLEVKQRTLAELERTSLRRAVVEERRRFAELITCLKPVLDSQTAIFSDVGSIEECIATILKHTYDPNELSADTEQAIELAVEQVASRIQLPERKRSDARSAIRFGKSALFNGSNNGSKSDFQRSSLSGHASQLSLQSAISSSTSVSWNAIATAAAAVSTTLVGNRSSSPPHNSYVSVDPVKTSPLSPCGISTTSAFGFGGDSVSLFENGDSSHVDTVSLGLNPCDRSVAHYPTAGDYGDAFRTAQIGAYRPPFALDLDGAGITTAIVEAPSTDGLLNDTDHRPHEITAPTANTDEDEEEAGGGGTTEDTEDGETEDEERIGLSKSDVTKSQSILYPNQAIPAPVYTNLNELKRAAARKFGNTETDSHRTMEPTPYAIESPNPTNDSSSFSPPDVHVASLGSDEGRSNIVSSGSTNSADGFINTCVNSGTSTFRRRQSEYGRKGQQTSNDNLGTSRPVEYTSMTPALVRRVSQTRQDLIDSCGGRPRSRPVNPPRRSSSVSRDLTRVRNSSTDPYPTCAFQPTTTAYTLQSTSDHLRTNGPDVGVQRVSSSIFAQSDADTAHHSTNSPDKRAPMDLRNGRSDIVTAPHYASVSTSSSYSQQVNGTHTRSDRFPCVGLPLTPPPLATVPAPAYSKTNQLMFGVKVLPNQIPPTIGINYANQYYRLPQRTHQNSYGSGQFVPTQASTSMGSPLLGRAVYSQRGVLPPKPANNVVREDAITSFID